MCAAGSWDSQRGLSEGSLKCGILGFGVAPQPYVQLHLVQPKWGRLVNGVFVDRQQIGSRDLIIVQRRPDLYAALFDCARQMDWGR